MHPEIPINNIDDANREIARLREQLTRSAHDATNRVLVPVPPEFEYLDGNLQEILKDSVPFNEAFVDALVNEAK